MKRILIFSLCLLLVSATGCKGRNEDTSSISSVVTEVVETVSNPNGLFSSSAQEPVSESESSVVASSEEESTVESTPKIESDIESVVESTVQSDYGIIEPSSIDNPTGITSKGRKSNSDKDWKMTLVNPWNTLHKDYNVDLTTIDSRFSSGLQFDSRAVKYLNQMCEAAAEDGVSLWVISAFRTFDYQQMLFDNEVNEHRLAKPGASEEQLKTDASTEVARPGTSEHNLGLAVDFNSVEQSFENTAQYKWLQKHAHEYGFIMRYAADKQSITGVIYEPWHYRFVGVENAKSIKDSGLCLEEYLKR